MGLLDSIKDAAGSAVHAVGDGIGKTVDAVTHIDDAVRRAPELVAHGAKQALKGAVQLGHDIAHDPVGTAKRAAGQAWEGAKAVGRWSWEHKGQIGFWVGTTALLMAVPVSGGASGALAGGMMAARGAAIAAKVAQAGRIGATAVRAARAGVGMLQAARGAAAATRAGAAVVRGAGAVRAARVALGATKVGKAMIAAQKPLAAAGTVIAGANLADTTVKFTRGEASGKDLALSALAFAPAGIAGVRGVAARRAASANEAAAKVAASGLDDVAAQAAGATDEVAQVASVAPKVNAPRTAGAAAEARDQAAGTLDKAVHLRQRAAAATTAASGQRLSASRLADELDDVTATAHAARARAADAEHLAPDALTPVARDARVRLDAAEATAASTRQRVRNLATTQQRADRIADSARTLENAANTTSTHVWNVKNMVASTDDDRLSLTEGNALKGIASWLLGRNARTPAPAPARAA